jgi:hypothetical protein
MVVAKAKPDRVPATLATNTPSTNKVDGVGWPAVLTNR